MRGCGGLGTIINKHISMGNGPWKVCPSKQPPKVSEIILKSWCRRMVHGIHAARITSCRQGIDNGIHGLAVRIKGISIGHQVRVFAYLVQPEIEVALIKLEITVELNFHVYFKPCI